MRWRLQEESGDLIEIELLRQSGSRFVFEIRSPQKQVITLDLVAQSPTALECRWAPEDDDPLSCKSPGPENLPLESLPLERLLFEAWTPQRWRAATADSLVEVKALKHSSEESTHTSDIRSPMPGRVLRILTQPGATAKKGQTLVIVEAMKMENEIRAPRDLIVESVDIQASQSVEEGQKLLTLRLS